jgi:Protein of unknown function (DUF2505)
MKLREEIVYPAHVDQVFAMLCDPAFRRRVCEATYAVDHTVAVRSEGDLVIVSIVRVMPADVPPIVRGVVGDHIKIKQIERWSASEQGAQRTAALDMEIIGHPAGMAGCIVLAPDHGMTVGTVEGDMRVNIPIFGGRLANEMAKALRFALSVEAEVAKDYLSG